MATDEKKLSKLSEEFLRMVEFLVVQKDYTQTEVAQKLGMPSYKPSDIKLGRSSASREDLKKFKEVFWQELGIDSPKIEEPVSRKYFDEKMREMDSRMERQQRIIEDIVRAWESRLMDRIDKLINK